MIDDRQRSTYSMYSMLPWDSPYDEEGKIVGNRSSSWVNSNSTNYLYELQYNWSKYDSYALMATSILTSISLIGLRSLL